MTTKAIKQEVPERPHQVCRLCLSNNCLEDIFKAEGLQDWISEFLSIKITAEDRMSQAVCAICRHRLTEFNEYRTRCQEVQGMLNLMVQHEEADTRAHVTERPVTLSVSTVKLEKSGKQTRKDIPVHCPICNKLFRNKSYLKTHKWRVHAHRPHICPTCGRAFARRERFEIHKETHSIPSNNTRPEVTRFKILPSMSIKAVATKLKSENKDDIFEQPKPNSFQCQVCPKIFRNKRQLGDHKRIHGPKKFGCSVCGKSFAIHQHLQKHLQSHANQAKRNMEKIIPQITDAEQCVQNVSFIKTENALDKTQEQNTEMVETDPNHRNLKVLDKIIKDDSLIVDKVKIEYQSDTDLEISLYDIDIIDEEQAPPILTAAAEPDQPIQAENNIEYCEASLECYLCSKVFKNKRKFWDHNRLVHGPKNYKCTVCDRAFSLPGDRNRHMRSHKKNFKRQMSRQMKKPQGKNEALNQVKDDSNTILTTGQDLGGNQMNSAFPHNVNSGTEEPDKLGGDDEIAQSPEVRIELRSDDDEDDDSDEEISIIVPKNMFPNAFNTVEYGRSDDKTASEQQTDQVASLKVPL